MKRGQKYLEAIAWIATNDDTVWLDEGEEHISVTAQMVCDLFGKTEEQVRADLRIAIAKMKEKANG